MTRIQISLVTILAMGNFAYAGGGFIEPLYETEDVVMAEEVVVEEYMAPVEEYIAPIEEIQEEYIAPIVEEPVVVQPVAIVQPVEPVPIPVPTKAISTNGFYAGIGISATKFKSSCKSQGTSTCNKSASDKTAGIMGRVGYDLNKYIGVEARGLRTNWKSNGGKIKHAGVFVKPMIPVGENTNLYALAGVAKTTTQGKLQRVDTKSFAWGAGVEYDISADNAKNGRYNREFDGHGDQEQGLGVFADYERLVQKSGSPDLDTVNVGVTYDF